MARPRKLKDMPDRPPHRPLTSNEVERIAKAGGIDFGDRPEEAHKFEAALEHLRCYYEWHSQWKKLSLTDKQLRKRLQEVQGLARRLQKLLADPALDYQTWHLIEGDGEPRPELADTLEPLDAIIFRTKLGLRKLQERSVTCPNDWAISSAGKPGLNSLICSLVQLWQVATNTIKPEASDSRLVTFLRVGASVIAQHNVDAPAAARWARNFTPKALKRLDLGYLFFRYPTDPEFLQYVREHGVDCLEGLT